MNNLLNCPFCGKPARYVPADYINNDGAPWPFAECNDCNCGAPVEFWNQRATPTLPPYLLSEFAEAFAGLGMHGYVKTINAYLNVQKDSVEVVQADNADQALTLLDFALSFALCNHDHAGTRRDVKKAQAHLETYRKLKAEGGANLEYPPCDYCGVVPTYHPWHGSGELNGVENKHIHACNECRSKLPDYSLVVGFKVVEDPSLPVDGIKFGKPRAFATYGEGGELRLTRHGQVNNGVQVELYTLEEICKAFGVPLEV